MAPLALARAPTLFMGGGGAMLVSKASLASMVDMSIVRSDSVVSRELMKVEQAFLVTAVFTGTVFPVVLTGGGIGVARTGALLAWRALEAAVGCSTRAPAPRPPSGALELALVSTVVLRLVASVEGVVSAPLLEDVVTAVPPLLELESVMPGGVVSVVPSRLESEVRVASPTSSNAPSVLSAMVAQTLLCNTQH